MLYPILFIPIIKKMVWGSESWDISCRFNDNEMGVVENGFLAGTPFNELIAKNPEAFLGSRAYNIYKKRGFPLLIKIIDANDDLSVQVHPDDAYAAARGLESGKSEMWYVMKAPEGGSLIAGTTDDATPEKLRANPMACLKKLPVKQGDIIDIPAGLVHAITKGIMVAEVQQNSDITFRLYDYNRLGLDGSPRELHIDDGIAVTNFELKWQSGQSSVKNDHFTVLKYEVKGELKEKSDPEAFAVFTCVEGSCTINDVEVICGRSVFVPAALGQYAIIGKAVLLKSTV